MILRAVDITNFKNIERATLEFSPKVNCLLGDNGMGKSNLLDALHMLSFTKSFTERLTRCSYARARTSP